MEGIKAKNLSAVLTLVDFRKAFDSINRAKMLDILRPYGGVPDQIVSAVASMYCNTEAKVHSPDGETDFYAILAAVLQGHTLVLYLFIVSLDYAMRSVTEGFKDLGFTLHERRSRGNPTVMITDTDLAGNIAMTSDNLEKAQAGRNCCQGGWVGGWVGG